VSEPWWAALLREQQAAGFPDLRGAEGWVRIPVSDAFISRLIRSRVPPHIVADLDLSAEPGNQFVVALRLARARFLPALRIRFLIEAQPVLPESPVLILRLASQGWAALAGPALRLLQALPPGIRLDGDRVAVDLAVLLARAGAPDLVRHLAAIEVTTAAGRVTFACRARLDG